MPRITAEQLQAMSDEDYKKLTPEQLATVNNVMPTQDYTNPYSPSDHPYPRMLYSLIETPNGGKKLKSARVNDARSEEELRLQGEEWKTSIAAWGIETHPAAPDVVVEEYAIEFAPGEEARVIAAGS
jgi:hypothetical protein